MPVTQSQPPPGPEARARRFTLLDAVALVAAAGAGVALIRAYWGPGLPAPVARVAEPGPLWRGWTPWIIVQRANGVGRVVTVGLVGVTPGLMALRLRGPRPPLRALMLRPGSAAIVIATLGLAWRAAGAVAREVLFQAAGVRKSWREAFSQEPAGHMPGYLFQEGATIMIGSALLIYATILLAIRPGRRGGDWVDRVGVGLGTLWVLLCLLDRLSNVSEYIVGYLP